MKDLPHHMKKLNRQVVRSIHHEEMEDANFENKLPSPPNWKPTAHQIKKQAKEKETQERLTRKPIHKTEEERNKEMKHRTPIFDRTSHPRPKGTKASHKKTPRI
jgi:hypothetical protein